MARLIHYGKKFLRKVRSVKQGSDATAGLGKPCGLWVSVEGEQDWKEWCEAEQFGCLDCATQVILKPEARILWLRGTVGLDKFHEEYSFEQYRSGTYTRMAIRWPSVAEKFQGIIIAPYVWSRRLNGPVSNWYYGWDCASGCIWDAEAVAELRPIEQAEAA